MTKSKKNKGRPNVSRRSRSNKNYIKKGPIPSKKENKKYSILAYFTNTIFDLSDGYDINKKEKSKFMNKFKKETEKNNIKIIGSQIGSDKQTEMYLDAYLSGKKKDILLMLKNLKAIRYTIEMIKSTNFF